jgi:hypothetical protein
MTDIPNDIYTEPDADPDTLGNLGPLAPLAGIWVSVRGRDVHPTVGGSEEEAYVERYELQPIDPQTNGPQLFYGLRYHTHITKPGEVAMFHDQVGYWLWEPATGTVLLTLAIPRGQVAMAAGQVAADARHFTLRADRGAETTGIISNPFLEQAFKTTAFEITVTIHENGTWSYEQTTTLLIRGRTEPFRHTDHNTLGRVGKPRPNPLASHGVQQETSSGVESH